MQLIYTDQTHGRAFDVVHVHARHDPRPMTLEEERMATAERERAAIQRAKEIEEGHEYSRTYVQEGWIFWP